MLAAYVSGHGYGHATRVGEVLREVRRREPTLPITIVTSGPEQLYRRAVPRPIEVRSEACDVGLAQKSALVIDEAGTVDAWRRFQAGYDARRGAEGAGARHVQAPFPWLHYDDAIKLMYSGLSSRILADPAFTRPSRGAPGCPRATSACR